MFNYEVLRDATNNFAEATILGRGGFGSVYKGILEDGQQIAIKRLHLICVQGQRQLENEIALVTQLQHRNLVRVLGYCLEGEETMLVYEFLPNRSLDEFLKDQHRCEQLTWETRFKIIKGIAQGLLYLHKDSRVTVVHRDMKTGNILLDDNMDPRISDFGLASILDDKTHAAATRVAGSPGYMAPECLAQGIYSLQGDVYSFGIIILEVVTGKLVSYFRARLGLRSYVAQLWNDQQPMQALDPRLGGICMSKEVIASLYIGLWCSQENRSSRPSMSEIVGMLNTLPSMSEISQIIF